MAVKSEASTFIPFQFSPSEAPGFSRKGVQTALPTASRMERPLRCNNQIGGFCRAQLNQEAVITTCSHILCLPCAEKTGFANARLEHRSCPVCSTPLPSVDDAVQSRLSPSEDYKTSVLSGLDPTTIMECAGRALAFWTYQTTQEICYQEHMLKTVSGKHAALNSEMDKMIHAANSEIKNLQTRLTETVFDQKTLQQKYDELATAYKNKTNKYNQAQYLYDTLKKKVMMEKNIGTATLDATQALQSLDDRPRPATYNDQGYGQAVSPPRSLSGRGQFDETRMFQRQTQVSPSRALASYSQNMGPPPRPDRLRRDQLTPQHRTVLPGATRPTANRSQIPMSAARIDTRQSYEIPIASQLSSLRHQVVVDGPIQRASTSTPRAYRGISGGMKTGTVRAGTADDGVAKKFGHHDTGSIRNIQPPSSHRPADSFDENARMF